MILIRRTSAIPICLDNADWHEGLLYTVTRVRHCWWDHLHAVNQNRKRSKR